MSGFGGSVAIKLDFGEQPTVISSTGGRGRAGLRLAPSLGRLTGPDKYRVLASRRRRAQIAARRLLELFDEPAPQGNL